jgi:(p)ppGpp synthase/HD superfamily hydrolase
MNLDKIREFVISKHKEKNQMYGDKPYSFHLEYTVRIANKFLHLIPENKIDNVLSSCWCHDLLEDTDLTYEQLKQVTNKEVADIVLSVTTKKGTRKERFNDEYYTGIDNTEFATFVKLCDRIANVRHSIESNNDKLLKMYEKENFKFQSKLYDSTYKLMFNYLSELFYNEDKINY